LFCNGNRWHFGFRLGLVNAGLLVRQPAVDPIRDPNILEAICLDRLEVSRGPPLRHVEAMAALLTTFKSSPKRV
jgi:hypothetical protein